MELGGWFYEVRGERRGPVSLDELKQLAHAHVVARDTPVWAAGMEKPVIAGNVPVLYPPTPEPWMRWVLPVGRSGFAIGAGYLGLFSFIPLVGVLAIAFGVLAIWDLRRHRHKIGWGRVVTALVLGSLFSTVYAVALLRH